jgi:hypothetical protein
MNLKYIPQLLKHEILRQITLIYDKQKAIFISSKIQKYLIFLKTGIEIWLYKCGT